MSEVKRLEYLPFEPLMKWELLAKSRFQRGGRSTGPWPGYHGDRFSRAWYRAKTSGRITVTQADEICVHVLGLHPVDVFGPLWLEPVE